MSIIGTEKYKLIYKGRLVKKGKEYWNFFLLHFLDIYLKVHIF